LQSTNEELQSTNEELQSTNEEMETSKEELQSVNEELTTVNAELQSKIDQLVQTESLLKNLLDNTNVGTIFLDHKLRIVRFTLEAVKVVPLIPTDVGRPLAHIATNLDYDNLVADTREVLNTLLSIEREVHSKEGRTYLMCIMPYRVPNQGPEGVVLSFTDISLAMDLTQERAARLYAESVVYAVREPLVVLDATLHILSANEAFFSVFGIPKGTAEGILLYDLGNRQWDVPELRQLLEKVLPTNETFRDFKVEYDFGPEGRKVVYLNGGAIMRNGKPYHILLSIDVERLNE
jgi:two-component system, chemotaxis family, CheB/CheR fusion protein